MAADDIYSVKLYFEAPSGVATCGLYYQETVGVTSIENECATLGVAWEDKLGALVLDVMSDEWEFPCIIVNKLTGLPKPRVRIDRTLLPGTRVNTALPANNALQFNLSQALFSPRSNGKIYLPPPPEEDQTDGVLKAAYSNGPVAALTTELGQTIPELAAGTGVFQLGVISAQIRDAALPFKDWDGAFADVLNVSSQGIIATARRRQTRVMGWS
jgi:hypothetical protein